MARKRLREREREEQKRAREKTEERKVVCKRSPFARIRRKVLSTRQNARSAPLKRDPFRNERNCQIAIIGSFLNERDSC